MPGCDWLALWIIGEINWSMRVEALETMSLTRIGKFHREQSRSRLRLDWLRCATLNFLRSPYGNRRRRGGSRTRPAQSKPFTSSSRLGKAVSQLNRFMNPAPLLGRGGEDF